MVLPPDWAASTTVDSLVAHYRAVAEKIPVMVVTGFLLRRSDQFGLDVIKALRDHVPGVVTLKDDKTGPWIRKVCLMTHDRWALSAGGQKQNHMNMVPYGVGGSNRPIGSNSIPSRDLLTLRWTSTQRWGAW